MLGFLPGFAYLGPLPERLEMPRKGTPRLRVPAGAVAVAGGMTAVYPAATPGGWNLIGRTTTPLFDPGRDPPSLIQPGDRVRFARVRDLPSLAAPGRAAPSSSPPVVEVLDGGLLTTVQDLGRFGHRRQGVPWAGAMDAPATYKPTLHARVRSQLPFLHMPDGLPRYPGTSVPRPGDPQT